MNLEPWTWTLRNHLVPWVLFYLMIFGSVWDACSSVGWGSSTNCHSAPLQLDKQEINSHPATSRAVRSHQHRNNMVISHRGGSALSQEVSVNVLDSFPAFCPVHAEIWCRYAALPNAVLSNSWQEHEWMYFQKCQSFHQWLFRLGKDCIF